MPNLYRHRQQRSERADSTSGRTARRLVLATIPRLSRSTPIRPVLWDGTDPAPRGHRPVARQTKRCGAERSGGLP